MRSLHFETGMCIVVGGMFVHVAVFGQFLFSEFLFLSRFYKTSSRILQLAKSFVITVSYTHLTLLTISRV